MLREQEEGGRSWPRPRSGRLTATSNGSGAAVQKERAEEPHSQKAGLAAAGQMLAQRRNHSIWGAANYPAARPRGNSGGAGKASDMPEPRSQLQLRWPSLLCRPACSRGGSPGLFPPRHSARLTGLVVTISGSSSAGSHVGALPAHPARPCTASGSGRHECLQVGAEEAGPGEVSIAARSAAVFPAGLGFIVWASVDETHSLLSRMLCAPRPVGGRALPSTLQGLPGRLTAAPVAATRVPGLGATSRLCACPQAQVHPLACPAGCQRVNRWSFPDGLLPLARLHSPAGRARCHWAFTEGRLL